MIITQLNGGLGNQMFQYAVGRALALKHKTPLFLDLSLLEQNHPDITYRSYELNTFEIEENFVTPDNLELFHSENNNVFKRLKSKLFPLACNYVMYYERGYGFDPRFLKLPANTYLKGYWQNEAYFSSIRDQLKKDFKTKTKLPPELLAIYTQTLSTNSVSIHVRRGDYLSLKSANSFHGVLGVDYYSKAINRVVQKTSEPEFFVFSDDIAWCKSNLKAEAPFHFIEHKYAAVWDMFLMCHCKQHIIANSSFSWWAAWLNDSEHKQVIAPKNWFNSLSIADDAIVPKRWMKL